MLLAGTAETLRCTGRGIPTPSLSWHRNGVEVRNQTLSNIFVVESARSDSYTAESLLVIEVATPSHEGNFTCRATNAFGEGFATSFLRVLTGD